MSITTNTSSGAGVYTSTRDNHNVAFPRRDGANKSHIFLVDAQPIMVRSAEYPAGVAAKFQITPDSGKLWADWKVHGQQVLVSADNPFQWVSFSGHYRLVLIDEATGAEYTGQAQPLITFFAGTNTHEHQWTLVPGSVGAAQPTPPTTVATAITVNTSNKAFLTVTVNGVNSVPVEIPCTCPTTRPTLALSCPQPNAGSGWFVVQVTVPATWPTDTLTIAARSATQPLFIPQFGAFMPNPILHVQGTPTEYNVDLQANNVGVSPDVLFSFFGFGWELISVSQGNVSVAIADNPACGF